MSLLVTRFFFWCLQISVVNWSRAFWDKRISQEVNGDALGEVLPLTLNLENYFWIYFINWKTLMNVILIIIVLYVWCMILLLIGIQRLCLQNHRRMWQTRFSNEAGSVNSWSCSPLAPPRYNSLHSFLYT